MTKVSVKFNLELFLCCSIVTLYIVGGNAMTINLGERIPLKLAEFVSLPFIVYEIIKYHRDIRPKTIDYQILFWLFLGFASTVIKANKYNYPLFDIAYGTLYGFRIIYSIVLVNVVMTCFQKHKYSIHRVMMLLLRCYLLVCLIGFFQLAFFPIAHDWYRVFFDWGFYFANPDPHQNRLVSTYFDPNYLGVCLSIPVSIALYLWESSRKQKYMIYVFLFLLTCVLTASRSGFLGLAIVIVIMLLKKRYSKKQFVRNIFFIAIVIVAVIFMFLNGTRVIERILNSSTDNSTFSRFFSWASGWEIIRENAGIGIGYNMLGPYSENVLHQAVSMSTGYGNDSSLMLIIETTGSIGILYFIGILIFNLRKTRVKGLPKKVIVEMVAAALICCNFVNLLFYPLWLTPILLLVHTFAYYNVPMQSKSQISSPQLN